MELRARGPNLCKVTQLCPEEVPGIHLRWLCMGGRRKDRATLQPSGGEGELRELKACFDGAIFMLRSLATRFAVGFIQLSLPPQKRRMLVLLGTDVNSGKQVLAYF